MSRRDPSRLTWSERYWWTRAVISSTARRAAEAARHTGKEVHQVVAQGYKHAQLSGAKMARHIISIQRAADLPAKMMRRSAQSVVSRQHTRPSDRAFQAAYRAEAEKAGLLPGIPTRAERVRAPKAEPATRVTPEAESPLKFRSGTDREAV